MYLPSTQEDKTGGYWAQGQPGLLKTNKQNKANAYLTESKVHLFKVSFIMSSARLMLFKSLCMSMGSSVLMDTSTKYLPHLRLRKHCRKRGQKDCKGQRVRESAMRLCLLVTS